VAEPVFSEAVAAAAAEGDPLDASSFIDLAFLLIGLSEGAVGSEGRDGFV